MNKVTQMKKHRQKLSLIQTMNLFPDDETAEQWFINCRWQHGVDCPACGSKRVTERTTGKRSWRCKDCRKDFSTKTGTLMQGSNLGFRVWAIAIYQLTTCLKGIASTKLASDLGITQKAAWHLAMRIRETYGDRIAQLQGVVEVDETYIGGKKTNKHQSKRIPGRGPSGKQAVIGAKERGGNVRAKSIARTDSHHLHRVVLLCQLIEKNSHTDYPIFYPAKVSHVSEPGQHLS